MNLYVVALAVDWTPSRAALIPCSLSTSFLAIASTLASAASYFSVSSL